MEPCANAALNDEYLAIIAELDGDEAGRRAAWDYMKSSTAIWDGNVIYSSYFPKIFDRASYRAMEDIALTSHRIAVKAIREYRGNPAFRAAFTFDPRIEELMLLPDPTDQPLPFARFDIFLNEDDLTARFCEFNTDGSSGMNENRETWNSIRDCEPLRRFAQRHRVRDCNPQIFNGWVERFLRIYRSAPGAVEHPHIAVVDFLENSVTEEFKVYARLFEAAGCTFSVYDIRELDFADGRLRGAKPLIGQADVPIDAIWRRCLAADLLEHWDESGAFVDALRAQAFVLIGSFATNVIHDKQIFDVLARPECTGFLTQEERDFIARTVPATSPLASSHPQLAEIKANPHDWIIKPTDGYGCKDVIPGPDHEDDPAEWAEIIDAHVDGRAGAPFLVQRFCHPYRTPTMPFYNREEDFTAPARSYNNLEGLYLIDGEFAGVFCRLGPEALILGRHGGVTAPSLFVDVDD